VDFVSYVMSSVLHQATVTCDFFLFFYIIQYYYTAINVDVHRLIINSDLANPIYFVHGVALDLFSNCKEHFLLQFSNFSRVVDVVYCVLDSSPASECYKSTFRNNVSVPSS
jgi:hypothetical protein